MTPDERKLLSELFDRVQSASGNRRDPDAEAFIADNVRRQPYAPYLLAQAVIVQEEGLKNAAARIEQLERELADAKAHGQQSSSAGGGFLGSIFGGGSQQRAPEPAPQPQGGQGPWAYQRGGSVPSVNPQGGGGWMSQQPQQQGGMPGQMQAPQGGSFLRGALGTAAGVAGGMMLANSLSGLFNHGNNAHGIAGDLAGGGSKGDAASLASNDDSSIAGNVFDDKSGGGGSDYNTQPASFDDGGWDTGGDDGSYDA